MSEIDDIQRQINELHAKKQAIISEQDENLVKDLSWTANCDAILSICPYDDMGKYRINLIGKIPDCYKTVTVFGESQNYWKNIVFRNKIMSDFPSFETNNASSLISFLKTVRFKSVKYDKESLKVLQAFSNLVTE